MKDSKGLMGLPSPLSGYEGVVRVGNQSVQVSDGIMRLGQKQFHVEENGAVQDESNKTVAMVKNGQLVPIQQGAG